MSLSRSKILRGELGGPAAARSRWLESSRGSRAQPLRRDDRVKPNFQHEHAVATPSASAPPEPPSADSRSSTIGVSRPPPRGCCAPAASDCPRSRRPARVCAPGVSMRVSTGAPIFSKPSSIRRTPSGSPRGAGNCRVALQGFPWYLLPPLLVAITITENPGRAPGPPSPHMAGSVAEQARSPCMLDKIGEDWCSGSRGCTPAGWRATITPLHRGEPLVDLSAKLETADKIYLGLPPMQRVMVARHPRRPYTLDYLSTIFTDFIELHGDRLFRDDRAAPSAGSLGPARKKPGSRVEKCDRPPEGAGYQGKLKRQLRHAAPP